MASLPRSLEATASTVRCSILMQSGMERVAQPSGDEAMRFYPSPEQSRPAILMIPPSLLVSPLSVGVRMAGPSCDLCEGSGTTLVEQMRPALGWRCRCPMFRSSEARNGMSFGIEQMRNLVWSSHSTEQRSPAILISSVIL